MVKLSNTTYVDKHFLLLRLPFPIMFSKKSYRHIKKVHNPPISLSYCVNCEFGTDDNDASMTYTVGSWNCLI